MERITIADPVGMIKAVGTGELNDAWRLAVHILQLAIPTLAVFTVEQVAEFCAEAAKDPTPPYMIHILDQLDAYAKDNPLVVDVDIEGE